MYDSKRPVTTPYRVHALYLLQQLLQRAWRSYTWKYTRHTLLIYFLTILCKRDIYFLLYSKILCFLVWSACLCREGQGKTASFSR